MGFFVKEEGRDMGDGQLSQSMVNVYHYSLLQLFLKQHNKFNQR